LMLKMRQFLHFPIMIVIFSGRKLLVSLYRPDV
jgi:hypothetical protein